MLATSVVLERPDIKLSVAENFLLIDKPKHDHIRLATSQEIF
jgi:hypothetical protein